LTRRLFLAGPQPAAANHRAYGRRPSGPAFRAGSPGRGL